MITQNGHTKQNDINDEKVTLEHLIESISDGTNDLQKSEMLKQENKTH